MGWWFERPDTARLVLDDDADKWLLVRRRLTVGQQRAMLTRMAVTAPDGELQVNKLEVGRALVLAYLIDWSATDASGAPVSIRDLSPDALGEFLDNLSPEAWAAVRGAVEAHELAMAEERLAEKKTRSGSTPRPLTLPSPFAAAGASTG